MQTYFSPFKDLIFGEIPVFIEISVIMEAELDFSYLNDQNTIYAFVMVKPVGYFRDLACCQDICCVKYVFFKII